ncbi:hypothetical protein COT44_03450 [Candidatus Shapirobacteria bacterium CG08_land_8_20_14_0_20_39_18]|uniref:Nucleotidyl transferase AbiEii/AbiGii toxin family protein n=1 Tax=Candidatus Shapirobacteria bacterium CG08_land_8_20_14_0_20_39_18 TaxID=1974883 RepID=A0A2M6XCU5_9BACT|nr:MAG: hypothetical protein COT44_03450 [Candidatus Shapirobacteria bacterium CG08_land_8_20_14_0_20_39_18]PIY65116.1 MAG: hypothetical protein COY91_03560 [Candidatus Shapirobacteria bacterium CG_4_10_14_0_8_um_filter_39_15]PJE68300.1 MAG: hypothetical protein COU94_02625 [Candidatus Shapirobacteria bacterium CG10_big_fil_rev_8_21_14_0_10_38_8]
MVNIDLHRTIFINILREIYSDPSLRSVLGFKGGTAAFLFYGLPRFSVDLDFDLLDLKQKEVVFTRLKEILPNFGTLTEAIEKRYTLFFLLNYQKGERNLKVEISKRPVKADFTIKNYLGISMLVMAPADMAAGKISALLTRKRFASRDVYDVWFYLKNNWPINEKLLQEKTGMSLANALKKAQEKVNGLKKTELLSGLGELLDNKQKMWVREKLIEETIYYLKLYQSQILDLRH